MVTVMMVTQFSCPTQCTLSNRFKVTLIAFVWPLPCVICVLSAFVEWSLECCRQTNRLQQNATQYAEIPNQLPGISLFDCNRSPDRNYVEKIGHGVLTCVAALSQLSTSAAPPDRELPRSLPPDQDHKSPLPRSQGPLSMR